MKFVCRLLTVACVIALTACTTMKKPTASQPLMKSGKISWRITRQGEMPYLAYLPKDYDPKSGHRWPLMLFLHGAGERGTNVQNVAIHGPLKLVKKGKNFPFIIVAPLCPADGNWSNEPLLKLLDHVTGEFAVDTNRIYLTGLSMGGYGTWNLGLAHHEKFAALAPVCGGGSMIDLILPGYGKPVNPLRNLPVWAFHGAKDDVVPPAESESMIAAMKKIGAKDVKLTIYPNANHDAWTETYENPELYEWLLEHSR
jgi:predicted peptidase